MAPNRETPELSIIAPVFNEAANIAPFLARIKPVLERCVRSFEIVFIDDGSNDDTLNQVKRAHGEDPRVRAISFSRNFGKEIAIAAGLDAVCGQGAVIIDVDLQHPPEKIEEFVAKWREGFENVYGQRADRSADSKLRRTLTKRFYRLFSRFGEIDLPPGAGDFRLLDRKIIDVLKSMPERSRFSKGLYAWVGFRAVGVPFDVAPRAAGESKYSYSKLTRFAFDGLMSFSSAPLMMSTFIGVLVSVFALNMAVYFLIRTIYFGVDVPGYASLIVSVMFFAGVQLLSLGVMGEYIGRIFAEVKRRPLYIVSQNIGSAAPERSCAERNGAL